MRIFFYILKDFYKYVLAVIALCVFLFILFDFIHRTTRYFSEYQPDASLIVRMYLYQTPSNLIQALPIAVLLSSVITMVLLSRTNEITAMRAAGMSPMGLAVPLICGGLSISLATFFLGEFIQPISARKMKYVKEVLIEKDSENDFDRSLQWARKDQTIVNFREYDRSKTRLLGVKVVSVNSLFRPETVIEAQTADFLQDRNQWILESPVVSIMSPSGTLARLEKPPSVTLELPIDPTQVRKERRDTSEISARELSDKIKQGDSSGANTLSARVDFHLKFSYPFAAFVVSLIGLRFGFRSERKTETARGILLAFTIGISYWFVLNAMRAVGKRGDLSPIIAAWAPNIFMLVIVYFMNFRKQPVRKSQRA